VPGVPPGLPPSRPLLGASDKRPLIGHSPPGFTPHALRVYIRHLMYRPVAKLRELTRARAVLRVRLRAGAKERPAAAWRSRRAPFAPSSLTARTANTPPARPVWRALGKRKKLLALGVAFFVVRFFWGRWSRRLVRDLSDTEKKGSGYALCIELKSGIMQPWLDR